MKFKCYYLGQPHYRHPDVIQFMGGYYQTPQQAHEAAQQHKEHLWGCGIYEAIDGDVPKLIAYSEDEIIYL